MKFIVAGLLVAITGCVATVRPAPVVVEAEGPPPPVVVQTAPPPLQVEVIPIAPSPNHFWIAGHWHWEGRWVWRPGHYVLRRVGYRWVSPHYEPRGGAFVYVGGHWAR
jgi:hypothetical protein